MLQTNVTSVFLLTKLFVKGMMQRDRGHIINISSIAGKEAYGGEGRGLPGHRGNGLTLMTCHAQPHHAPPLLYTHLEVNPGASSRQTRACPPPGVACTLPLRRLGLHGQQACAGGTDHGRPARPRRHQHPRDQHQPRRVEVQGRGRGAGRGAGWGAQMHKCWPSLLAPLLTHLHMPAQALCAPSSAWCGSRATRQQQTQCTRCGMHGQRRRGAKQ